MLLLTLFTGRIKIIPGLKSYHDHQNDPRANDVTQIKLLKIYFVSTNNFGHSNHCILKCRDCDMDLPLASLPSRQVNNLGPYDNGAGAPFLP